MLRVTLQLLVAGGGSAFAIRDPSGRSRRSRQTSSGGPRPAGLQPTSKPIYSAGT